MSAVERRGFAPRSLPCEGSALLVSDRPVLFRGVGRSCTGYLLVAVQALSYLSFDPFLVADREGIEPSLRVLEARLVSMTLRPSASHGSRTRLTP